MRRLTMFLPVLAGIAMLGAASVPAAAAQDIVPIDWKRHGYYGPPPRWAPPPRHYYAPPPPRYYYPPPVYYAPPPPPRRYYAPQPGIGLYFRF